MLYLNLGNIRRSSLFPRDPKFVLVDDWLTRFLGVLLRRMLE
jgi:hypothetical protein